MRKPVNNLRRIEHLKSMVDQNLAQVRNMIDSGNTPGPERL
ncbi:MAG: hypothetical protein U5L00_18910 [Desulfovermiculus sp.]|nr:hypothetical protein [Desulfovermiculus sp.]